VQKQGLCTAVAALLHYVILTSFLWLLVDAVVQLKPSIASAKHYIVKASFMAWGEWNIFFSHRTKNCSLTTYLHAIRFSRCIIRLSFCARAHLHTHTHTHARSHARTHTHTHTLAHTHTRTHTHSHTHTHAHTHSYTHIHTYTHTHAHTHTHTHTHTSADGCVKGSLALTVCLRGMLIAALVSSPFVPIDGPISP
jgi:hypothetical protein